MSAPEVTAAVRRGAARLAGTYLLPKPGESELIHKTRVTLDSALDVEEMARAADPEAFEDHPIESRSHVAAIQWAARRKIATDHAQRIRAAILGGAA